MDITITKTDWYYKIEESKGNNIYLEHIPKKIKTITLIIIKELPQEIKEQIIDNLIIGTLKDEYIYEKIIIELEKEEMMLYCKDYE